MKKAVDKLIWGWYNGLKKWEETMIFAIWAISTSLGTLATVMLIHKVRGY